MRTDQLVRRGDALFPSFTSNLDVERVDFALRRPGRIDVVLAFPRPTAALRRRLIVERWHEDIRAAIDLDRALEWGQIAARHACTLRGHEIDRLMTRAELRAASRELRGEV
ncbi:MAG: hypothetical protein HC915_16185 [Anaerolineae bacterium]|nr:hypothetical protein [Anaerolineae bacterium]